MFYFLFFETSRVRSSSSFFPYFSSFNIYIFYNFQQSTLMAFKQKSVSKDIKKWLKKTDRYKNKCVSFWNRLLHQYDFKKKKANTTDLWQPVFVADILCWRHQLQRSEVTCYVDDGCSWYAHRRWRLFWSSHL